MATSVGLATRGVIAPNGQTVALATRGLEILFDLPAADPYLPIHITQIVPGMSVQVAMKPGHGFIVRHTKRGPVLAPSINDRGRTKGNEEITLIGTVTSNTPTQGRFKMNAHSILKSRVLPAEVDYSDIRFLHRVVNHREIVETGSGPGAQAFGTKLLGGMLSQPRNKLIRIKM